MDGDDDEWARKYARAYPCVRSGYCCNSVTCTEGLRRGSEGTGRKGNGRVCDFLRGDTPGEYRCGLYEDGDITGDEVGGIGAGCTSTLFNSARESVLRRRARPAGDDGDREA